MILYNVFRKTILLTFLLFACILVSCKDDDKDPETVDNNEIVGLWDLESIEPEDPTKTIPALALLPVAAPCYLDLKFTFVSDNTVSASGCESATALLTSTGYLTVGQSTRWKVENNVLTLTTGTATQSFPIKQDGDNMTLTVNTATAPSPALNALLKFKRI